MQITSFLVIFTLLLPFLTGIEPILAVGGVLFVTILMQTMFLFAVETVSPEDYVWYKPKDIRTPVQDKIRGLSIISAGVSVIIALLVFIHVLGIFPLIPEQISPFLYAALPTTPLIVPGLYVYFAENKLSQIEGQFPSFIRALGTIESVKQTSTSSVLASLKNKDFGYLTKYIRELYRRLNIGIDDQKAWWFFAAGIGSQLTKSFADMYVLGRDKGGDPETLGLVISKNYTEVLNLRQKREQTMGTVMSQSHGMTIVASITFFIGYEILVQIVTVTSGLDLPDGAAGTLINPGVYNLPILLALIFFAVVINSLLSSVLIKRGDRKHILGALLHFTILVWVSCLGGLAVHNFFTSFSLI